MCLGSLAGVMNACCGHGDITEAYVQFLDGFCIRGRDAKIVLGILKKWNNRVYAAGSGVIGLRGGSRESNAVSTSASEGPPKLT